MIKAQVKVSPRIIIEIEAEKQKDLFKAIASAEEVFGEKECGLCKSPDIKLMWRTADKVTGKKTETFEFPEFRCFNPNCRAHLSFGSHSDGGTLFPHRKLLPNGKSPGKDDNPDDAKYGDHNGWTKYRGEKD